MTSLFLLLALFAQVSGGHYGGDNGEPTFDAQGDPIFRAATISADEDSIISAEAEGTLVNLPIKEGDRVNEGTILATIDDRLSQAQVDAAKLGLEAATEKANDKIEEEYAILARDVAKVDWQKDQEANKRIPNSVTDIQILQKKLVFDRSNLQIDKARKDRVIATKEAAVKQAELEVANIGLAHRTTKAPFVGEVQELFQKEAQWVNPGDPILRLVKFDVLRAECFVKTDKYDPAELAGKPVTVKVKLARDREQLVKGRITHVSQTVEPGLDAYLVRAEIQNERDGDYWKIRPGLPAEMTIHVSQPAEPQARGTAIPAK